MVIAHLLYFCNFSEVSCVCSTFIEDNIYSVIMVSCICTISLLLLLQEIDLAILLYSYFTDYTIIIMNTTTHLAIFIADVYVTTYPERFSGQVGTNQVEHRVRNSISYVTGYNRYMAVHVV